MQSLAIERVLIWHCRHCQCNYTISSDWNSTGTFAVWVMSESGFQDRRCNRCGWNFGSWFVAKLNSGGRRPNDGVHTSELKIYLVPEGKGHHAYLRVAMYVFETIIYKLSTTLGKYYCKWQFIALMIGVIRKSQQSQGICPVPQPWFTVVCVC